MSKKPEFRSVEERRREVAGWRASGQSGKAYARSRGYSHSSLTNWATTLRADSILDAPRMVRVTVEKPRAGLVVEVGEACIRVSEGFDPELLRKVIEALEGRSK